MHGRRIDTREAIVALVILAALNLSSAATLAQEIERPLQLEVFINGEPTRLVGAFSQYSDGRLAATRAELRDLGIKSPTSGPDGELIVLRAIGDYRYDEPRQRIYFTLNDERRVPKIFDLRGTTTETPPPVTDYGALVNYQVFASSTKNPGGFFNFSGANAILDGRVFGPLGYLAQSAIIGTTTSSRTPTALRLESTYTYTDPDSLRSVRFGDIISSGLAWTRSIRLGGVQLQRDFTLRPDLITQPLPSISGSAAVPSTLDVYVNNLRVQSQDVAPGPFAVTNIPAITPAGSAELVLRDVTGRQTTASVPFFTSPRLLRQGIYDYSVEVGAPRLRYGIESNSYAKQIAASASLRGGIFDCLTVEAHAEGSNRLQNAGLGVVADLAARGILSLAISGSRAGGHTGVSTYAALDTRIGNIYVHASSQRTFGQYLDLAAITVTLPFFSLPSTSTLGFSSINPFISALPPRAVDNISFGAPLGWDIGQIAAGYVHVVPQIGRTSNLVTLTYSRPIFSFGSFFMNGFVDLSDRRNIGVFAGMSMPIDTSFGAFAPTNVTSGVARAGRSLNAFVEAIRTIQPEPGSYGWRVRNSEGAYRERLASGAYRSAYGQLEGYVQQFGRSVNGGITAQGAIAAMGGGVFLTNRIHDAFAVVDAGAPNVDVMYENRPAGKTNASGLALIPTLRSFQRNKIDIDIRNLPVNAEVERTKDIVAPANRGGVLVKFGIKTDIPAAIVIFAQDDKRFIEAGAEGQLESTGETFVVGYDGRAYIKGLARENVVRIKLSNGECRASFAYAEMSRDGQTVIGPVACR